MRTQARLACALVTLALSTLAPEAGSAESRSLSVIVTYHGAGAVDEAHKLFVQVFDTSYIGHEGVKPIAERAVARNGENADFELAQSPVFIAVFYDRAGACSKECSDPPSGSPAALYGAQPGQADPVEIPGGERREIRVSFDDSMTMP